MKSKIYAYNVDGNWLASVETGISMPVGEWERSEEVSLVNSSGGNGLASIALCRNCVVCGFV